MEETARQKYIKILLSDFSGRSLGRSEESYFRSLEKYLEQNKQSYEFGWKVCTINVHDKNHAIRIGLHFNLPQVEYFDGLKLAPIILKFKEKDYKKPKIFDASGKVTSLNKLKKKFSKERETNCIGKGEVIKRMILTKKEIEKAFDDGTLSPIHIMNKCFIDRQELARFIKNKK